MNIILDANSVIGEGFGASVRFKTLLSVARVLKYPIYIPQISLDEAMAKFPRVLEQEIQSVRDRLAKVGNYLRRDMQSSLDALDVETETQILWKTLSAQLSEGEVSVVDYPDVPHKAIINRATARRKPFDEKGSGYRDTLIWMTVLDLIPQTDDSIIFVSKDKDFRDKQGSLHPELVKEVTDLGLPSDRVVLVNDLAALMDRYIRPNLNRVFWENPLQVLEELGFDTIDSPAVSIQEEFASKEWDPYELGLSWEYETPILDSVNDVYDLNVLDVRELPDDQFLVKVEANLSTEFAVFMFKADWYVVEDDPRLYLVDFDWNDHGVLAGVSLPMHCEFDLVVDALNPANHEIQVVSLMALNQPMRDED